MATCRLHSSRQQVLLALAYVNLMETGISKRQIITSLASLAVVLGGLYALFRYFGITEVQTTIEHAGIWAPLVLVLAKASTLVFAPLGGSPLYPLAGALFGFWEGALLLMLGDALGAVVCFYISRIFGRHLTEKMIGDDQKFLSRAMRMMATTKGFLIARVCFMPAPEVSAYAAGLTRIRFLTFFPIQIIVGIVPTILLAGMGSVLTLDTWWVLPAAMLSGVFFIPIAFFVFRSTLREWEQGATEK
jgi:uncharacterized membrane protein YdjX (TVP38/TMEM64 family)